LLDPKPEFAAVKMNFDAEKFPPAHLASSRPVQRETAMRIEDDTDCYQGESTENLTVSPD
jgi:hypothetical protein